MMIALTLLCSAVVFQSYCNSWIGVRARMPFAWGQEGKKRTQVTDDREFARKAPGRF